MPQTRPPVFDEAFKKNVLARADLADIRRRWVSRDQALEKADDVAGVYIDINAGWKENGKVRGKETVEGERPILTIDHHDELSDNPYDTATMMMFSKLNDIAREVERQAQERLRTANKSGNDLERNRAKESLQRLQARRKGNDKPWLEGLLKSEKAYDVSSAAQFSAEALREARRSLKPYRNADGTLFLNHNHIDIDAIVSNLVFLKPNLALTFKEELVAMSRCSDFLLGSGTLKRGVTARDYVYMFDQYAADCRKTVIDARPPDAKKDARLAPDEQMVLMAHYFDAIIDVIEHPEKYLDYLKRGQDAHEQGMRQIADDVRDGRITVSSDENANIVVIDPGTTKDTYQLDGKYFYLRSRPDFNRPLVVTKRADAGKISFSVALNAQNHQKLESFNFESAITRIRAREQELILARLTPLASELTTVNDDLETGKEELKAAQQMRNPQIEELLGQLPALEADKKTNGRKIGEISKQIKSLRGIDQLEARQKELQTRQKDLTPKVKKFEDLAKKNASGQIWRSRTGMFFCFETQMTEQEFFTLLRETYPADGNTAEAVDPAIRALAKTVESLGTADFRTLTESLNGLLKSYSDKPKLAGPALRLMDLFIEKRDALKDESRFALDAMLKQPSNATLREWVELMAA